MASQRPKCLCHSTNPSRLRGRRRRQILLHLASENPIQREEGDSQLATSANATARLEEILSSASSFRVTEDDPAQRLQRPRTVAMVRRHPSSPHTPPPTSSILLKIRLAPRPKATTVCCALGLSAAAKEYGTFDTGSSQRRSLAASPHSVPPWILAAQRRRNVGCVVLRIAVQMKYGYWEGRIRERGRAALKARGRFTDDNERKGGCCPDGNCS
ncbi:hypothetical protein C8F01DRAFT_1092535 [Mycena amicta]|nr:hypothetical protein C8F01DRAFT_1092535 [Mycena amicta]